MNWALLVVLLGWSAVPSGLLLADRIFDVDSHTVLRRAGIPFLVASAALLVITGVAGPDYIELVAWGALAGLLGTVTLDIVRLIGLKAGAFPLDMPIVFGFMAYGRAGLLQSKVMSEVLRDAVRSGRIKEFIGERIGRLPELSDRRRVNAAAAMMGAVAALDETTRQLVSEAQFTALSELPEDGRRKVMATMDAAAATTAPGQPRGLPRVPFETFRAAAADAIAALDAADRPLMSRVRTAGYLWHAINGVSFGIGYALLAGQGNWGLAVAWGVLVWAAMMVTMPAMMPVLKLPGWFPIVPLLAHLAMILPFLALTVWVSSGAHQASLIGWLF